MMIVVIAACEVLFWVLLAAGLCARYVLRWSRCSTALLASVPVTDLVLLMASVVDLRRGAQPTLAHSLAAIYLGTSIAFGPAMVRWADGWFAHLVTKSPRPVTPRGPARARHELAMLRRHALAWGIGSALLALAHVLVWTDASAHEFLGKIIGWGVILIADTVWTLCEAASSVRGAHRTRGFRAGDTETPRHDQSRQSALR